MPLTPKRSARRSPEPPGSVAAWPRQAIDEARADWIGDEHKHDRHGSTRLKQLLRGRDASGKDDVGGARDKFCRIFANAAGIAPAPAILDPHVVAVGPAQLLQRPAGMPQDVAAGSDRPRCP